jgi:hypothetical protein
MEFIADPTVITIAASLVTMLLVYLLERVTKKEIDESGKVKLKGVVLRVLTFILTKIAKKKEDDKAAIKPLDEEDKK